MSATEMRKIMETITTESFDEDRYNLHMWAIAAVLKINYNAPFDDYHNPYVQTLEGGIDALEQLNLSDAELMQIKQTGALPDNVHFTLYDGFDEGE